MSYPKVAKLCKIYNYVPDNIKEVCFFYFRLSAHPKYAFFFSMGFA